MKRFTALLFAWGVALIATCNLEAYATILTFQIAGPGTANGTLEDGTYNDYGDNVNGLTSGIYTYGQGNAFTPNVVADYTHEAGAGPGHTYSTDPAFGGGVDYLAFNDGFDFWLTLTPDAGFGVTLNSFVIEEYDVTGFPDLLPLTPDVSWTVRQDNTSGAILASGSSLDFTSNVERTISPNVSYAGTLVLEINYTGAGGSAGIMAMDDVNFDQFAIPEPSSITLAMYALVAALFMTKRHRNKY